MEQKVSSILGRGSVMEQQLVWVRGRDEQTPPRAWSPLHSPLPAITPPSDRVYMQAAAVFRQLRPEKPANQQRLSYGRKADKANSKDESVERRAFQLAFSTLKYEALLEDIVTNSCFHTTQHIPSDMLPLAMVMLFDFQDRKFTQRKCSAKEEEEPLQEVRTMESSLQRHRTKLAASLARCRVRQRLQSVSALLSELVRTKQQRAKHLPCYAWVNTLRSSVEEVCEAFQKASFQEVMGVAELGGAAFCRDPLCPDTLVFTQQLHTRLHRSNLTHLHGLHTQDRTVCVAVSVLRPLLFERSDVLAVGSFSGLTAAHLAVAAAGRGSRVLVCGADHTPPQLQQLRDVLTRMDVKNVKILSEAFGGLHQWSQAVRRLKVVMVLPRCSCSALSDPVGVVHAEHGDVELLADLSHGSVSPSRLDILTRQQAQLLAHALSFQKVQTVVYCTRSLHPEENEQLVKRVLEKTHTHPKLLPFRVNGPIFPDRPSSGDALDSEFFRLGPSQFSNGCFIARLSRQPDPTKVESVQDVLARAAAKGLLGGVAPEEPRKGRKEKRRKDQREPPESRPSSPSSHDGETGNELDEAQAPLSAAGHDGQRGEDGREEGGKEGKRKGAKERKAKAKRRPKQSASRKKDQRRAKSKQQPRRHPRRRRARTIPRLTLTLMSSAKPSSCLSSITALAHKLSQSGGQAQQRPESSPRPPRGPDYTPRPPPGPGPDSGPCPPSGPDYTPQPPPGPDSSPRPTPGPGPDSGPCAPSGPDYTPRPPPGPAATRRPSRDAVRAEKPLRNIKVGSWKSRTRRVRLEAEALTQGGSGASSLVLPPISRPSHSSRSSSSSVSRQHSSSKSLLGS